MDVGGSASALPQKENTEAAVRKGCKIVKNTYLIMCPKGLDDCALCSSTIANFVFDPLLKRVKNRAKWAYTGSVTFICIIRIVVFNI